MPRIYFCDMKKFEHLYEECVSLLPEKRRKKAEKLINKNDALLSATAGLMMRELFGEKTEEIRFNEHGKPFFEHGPFFSISHSRQYSVVAVSENEIGIDIEMHESPSERLIDRCFTEDEQQFARLSTENFLRIWTAKEAVLKFLGTGFSFSPKNFSVLPLTEEHEIEGRKIRFFCGKIENVPITAAFCGNDDVFEIMEFQPEDLIY